MWKQPIHHRLEFGGNATLSGWVFPFLTLSDFSILYLPPIPYPSIHPPACILRLLNAHWALCSGEMHAGLIAHWTLFVSVMNGQAVCGTTEVVRTKASACKRMWWHDKWPAARASLTVQTGAQTADLKMKPIFNSRECSAVCAFVQHSFKILYSFRWGFGGWLRWNLFSHFGAFSSILKNIYSNALFIYDMNTLRP